MDGGVVEREEAGVHSCRPRGEHPAPRTLNTQGLFFSCILKWLVLCLEVWVEVELEPSQSRQFWFSLNGTYHPHVVCKAYYPFAKYSAYFSYNALFKRLDGG